MGGDCWEVEWVLGGRCGEVGVVRWVWGSVPVRSIRTEHRTEPTSFEPNFERFVLKNYQ